MRFHGVDGVFDFCALFLDLSTATEAFHDRRGRVGLYYAKQWAHKAAQTTRHIRGALVKRSQDQCQAVRMTLVHRKQARLNNQPLLLSTTISSGISWEKRPDIPPPHHSITQRFFLGVYTDRHRHQQKCAKTKRWCTWT